MSIIIREGLRPLIDVQVKRWDHLDEDQAKDMSHAFASLSAVLYGKHQPNVLQFALIEPKVVQRTVNKLRILFRNEDPPEDDAVRRVDPDASGANQGAPWRALIGRERPCMFLLDVDGRRLVGLNPVGDSFGNSPPQPASLPGILQPTHS